MNLYLDTISSNGASPYQLNVPKRVVITFDQLTGEEQLAVRAILESLAREGLQMTPDVRRLQNNEPLFEIRVAPDLLMLIRVRPEGPIDILEIARPATLQYLATLSHTSLR